MQVWVLISKKSLDIMQIWVYNIITETHKRVLNLNPTASVRKENIMEEMTDLQFKAIIKSIIQIIKDNDDKNEMIKKIEALVAKD